MMALISDVHGNLAALQAVLARIDALGCTRILSLGDVVGYYAQPGECIDALAERKVVNILGNHDFYQVNGTGCPRSKLVSEITEYHRKIISHRQLAWLSGSVDSIIEGDRYFVHGGWQDPVDQYIYQVNMADFPDAARWFFAGHTHVQVLMSAHGKTFCNPGAVGQPRDGDPRAAFAVMADDAVTMHRVEYDIDATAHHMRKAGFPPRSYENLYIGAQIGGRIDKVTLLEG